MELEKKLGAKKAHAAKVRKELEAVVQILLIHPVVTSYPIKGIDG